MSDIVERLLRWGYSADPSTANGLMGEAAAEIVRLRKKETELLAAGDLLESQLFSVAKQRDALRLTDAEREAIEAGAIAMEGFSWNESRTLRALLERLSGVAKKQE